MSVYDSYFEMLPSILGGEELVDPHDIASMGRKNQAKYLESVAQADELSAAGLVAEGTGIRMFVSSDRDNLHNERELAENSDAAIAVKRSLRSLMIDNPVEIVTNYDRGDVHDALEDDGVGHLLFFGHAKRGGVFVPRDPINWRNLGPRGHLKKSVGKIGCGIYDRLGVTPRFGFNLIDPVDGIIFGMADGSTNGAGNIRPSQMRRLDTFSALSPRMQQQTIAEPASTGSLVA